MIGVILCGGQSSRMGTDKGLLHRTGKSFVQKARDRLTDLGIAVFISINKSQEREYSAIFPAEALIVDDGSIDVKGPLLGIMSCHFRYTNDDLFVLACDLPLMESDMLHELSDEYLKSPGAPVYLFTNDGQPEPLCGIYTAQALSSARDMIENGKLSRSSMKFLLQQFVVKSIELSAQQKVFFRNFNNPSDLI